MNTQLTVNNDEKNNIIKMAMTKDCRFGANVDFGKFWLKVDWGQAIIGYTKKTNITYFHGFEGILMHQEIGDTFDLQNY